MSKLAPQHPNTVDNFHLNPYDTMEELVNVRLYDLETLGMGFGLPILDVATNFYHEISMENLFFADWVIQRAQIAKNKYREGLAKELYYFGIIGNYHEEDS